MKQITNINENVIMGNLSSLINKKEFLRNTIMLKNIFLKFSVVLVFMACSYDKTNTSNYVPIYDFNSFEPFLKKNNDTTYLINFWATWCTPCRIEMPHIEKIGEKYKNKKFKIILVSLDMPETVTSKLIPFIEQNRIQSQVFVLDDVNSNYWINKVDSNWSGNIPATIIYNRNKRVFYSKPVTYHILDSVLTTKFLSI